MKKSLVVTVAALSFTAFAGTAFCADGKQLFEKNCAVCHPNGGNIVKPDKTLSKKSMAAHGVKSEKDIVAKMRNPGPGMTKFDAKQIPDAQAKAIAKYIMKSFP